MLNGGGWECPTQRRAGQTKRAKQKCRLSRATSAGDECALIYPPLANGPANRHRCVSVSGRRASTVEAGPSLPTVDDIEDERAQYVVPDVVTQRKLRAYAARVSAFGPAPPPHAQGHTPFVFGAPLPAHPTPPILPTPTQRHLIAQLTNILHALGANTECACTGTTKAAPTPSAPAAAAPAVPAASLQVLPAKEKGSGSGSGSETTGRRMKDGARRENVLASSEQWSAWYSCPSRYRGTVWVDATPKRWSGDAAPFHSIDVCDRIESSYAGESQPTYLSPASRATVAAAVQQGAYPYPSSVAPSPTTAISLNTSGASYAGPSAGSHYGGSSASQSNYGGSRKLDELPQQYLRPRIHLRRLELNPDTIFQHTSFDLQQRAGPQHPRARPYAPATTVCLRLGVRVRFAERGDYG
ncbi:hypothetical protein B0H14DRAFT_3470279 [Mycena olivaceomarginata]|nr:hypothetical protein B0H14DRAFT_3470279 [Mycena olivaceomarginata]